MTEKELTSFAKRFRDISIELVESMDETRDQSSQVTLIAHFCSTAIPAMVMRGCPPKKIRDRAIEEILETIKMNIIDHMDDLEIRMKKEMKGAAHVNRTKDHI